MSDEIRLGSLGLKPGVIERIVTLAANGVDGVTVCGHGLAGLVQKGSSTRYVDVKVDEAGPVAVDIHIEVEYGRPLPEIATEVQTAIADAIRSQIGVSVESVDVYVDDVVFAQ